VTGYTRVTPRRLDTRRVQVHHHTLVRMPVARPPAESSVYRWNTVGWVRKFLPPCARYWVPFLIKFTEMSKMSVILCQGWGKATGVGYVRLWSPGPTNSDVPSAQHIRETLIYTKQEKTSPPTMPDPISNLMAWSSKVRASVSLILPSKTSNWLGLKPFHHVKV